MKSTSQKRTINKVEAVAALAALAALAAFAIYLSYSAISIGKWLSNVLENSHELFKYAVSLGTIIGGAVAAFVVAGLIYLHGHDLKKLAERVAESSFFKHLVDNRATYLPSFLSIALGSLIGVGLMDIKLPITPKPVVVVNKPIDSTVDREIEPLEARNDSVAIVPVPQRAVELPNFDRPLPQFAESFPRPRTDYCDPPLDRGAFNLGGFKLDACRALLDRQVLKGQGGARLAPNERIAWRQIGSVWTMEIIRMPLKRALPSKRVTLPLDIRPQ